MFQNNQVFLGEGFGFIRFISQSQYAQKLTARRKRHADHRPDCPSSVGLDTIAPSIIIVDNDRPARLPDHSRYAFAAPHNMPRRFGQRAKPNTRHQLSGFGFNQVEIAGIGFHDLTCAPDNIFQKDIEIELRDQLKGGFLQGKQVTVPPAQRFLTFP